MITVHLFKLRCNSHKIYHLKFYDSVVFSIFIMLFSHHHDLTPENVYSLKQNPKPISSQSAVHFLLWYFLSDIES